jgi:hypothetical protein
MNTFNIPDIPRTPFTDEQYQAMLRWYNSRDNLYDMIRRLERTKVYSQDDIDKMRRELDDNVNKIAAILKEFADLH